MNFKDYKSYLDKITLSKDSSDRIKNNLSSANQKNQWRKKANTFY